MIKLLPVLKYRSKRCNIDVLTYKDLVNNFIIRWNSRYPDNSIKLGNISVEQRKMLLIFLHLYF